jgi:hypothetical protein
MNRSNKLSFLGQMANAYIVYRPDVSLPHMDDDEDEYDDSDWSESEDDEE